MATVATTLRRRRSTSETAQYFQRLTVIGWIIEILKYLVLVILAISFMLPFFWMFTSALKDMPQIYTVPPIWFPKPAYWENFYNAWTAFPFNTWLYNTVVKYAVPVTVGTVLSSAIVAYGFARLQWRLRDILFAICLATMMVPGQVTLVPMFIVFKHLGWVGTMKPLVIPSFFGGGAWNIFLLRQFFMTLPLELSDAARIDGASEWGILFRIVMPLAKPALTVVALFRFMAAWNDYFGPLVYLARPQQWTLARGLERLRGGVYEVGSSRMAYPYLMAVSTLITFPILLAFFFAQRTFIEGISLTGIKG
ncbi:MAG: carbohydrate ABC transporter permease [Chloroflexi bacterium]|nr:carbohydrate ABC transporter permease [Chloroflexota bacterium]